MTVCSRHSCTNFARKRKWNSYKAKDTKTRTAETAGRMPFNMQQTDGIRKRFANNGGKEHLFENGPLNCNYNMLQQENMERFTSEIGVRMRINRSIMDYCSLSTESNPVGSTLNSVAESGISGR